MSNKAYYFGDANAIARLMQKMYFGVETEVPVYEEREVTTTKQLSVANLEDFFAVTTNTPTTDPWAFADTDTAEVRVAGIKKGSTQYGLTLRAQRALTGVAVDAAYYFSGMNGTLSIKVAGSSIVSRVLENADSQRQNYWTGSLSAGDTIQISGNHMMSSTSATPLVSVYISCDGITTTTTEQVQVGTENKELARKVIRAYQSDANGKAQLWFDADASAASVTFTGEHTVQDVTVDGVARKLYTLTGNGVLTVSGTVSFFMIGGGSSGERAKTTRIGNYPYMYSGRGGSGGHVASGSLSAGTWQITIGAGGDAATASGSILSNDGGDTTIVGSTDTYTAAGATITSGGTGGGGAWRKANSKSKAPESMPGGKGNGVSTIPFGLVDLLGKPGGGGGGGGLNSYSAVCSGGDGGTNGGGGKTGTSTDYVLAGGNGGADGGGNGGSGSNNNAVNGHPGTTPGSGGGGGATWSNSLGTGGAGADGAVWLLV